jgi:hypothetical protein
VLPTYPWCGAAGVEVGAASAFVVKLLRCEARLLPGGVAEASGQAGAVVSSRVGVGDAAPVAMFLVGEKQWNSCLVSLEIQAECDRHLHQEGDASVGPKAAGADQLTSRT